MALIYGKVYDGDIIDLCSVVAQTFSSDRIGIIACSGAGRNVSGQETYFLVLVHINDP